MWRAPKEQEVLMLQRLEIKIKAAAAREAATLQRRTCSIILGFRISRALCGKHGWCFIL